VDGIVCPLQGTLQGSIGFMRSTDDSHEGFGGLFAKTGVREAFPDYFRLKKLAPENRGLNKNRGQRGVS